MEFNIFTLEMEAKEKQTELLQNAAKKSILCSLPGLKNSAICGCTK
ncbi:hypothetical protein ACFFJY_03865 [Fictibacillus aquaticus]|nr:hypothetical protein [Fictibacillus aquaticus]